MAHPDNSQPKASEEEPDSNIPSLRVGGFPSFIAKEDTSSFVTKFQTKISGILALGLWSSLIACGAWHTISVGRISGLMMKSAVFLQENTEESQPINFDAFDKAFSMVGDTAKTLYAVVSPLATTVTGFYFVTRIDEQKRKNQRDEEEDC